MNFQAGDHVKCFVIDSHRPVVSLGHRFNEALNTQGPPSPHGARATGPLRNMVFQDPQGGFYVVHFYDQICIGVFAMISRPNAKWGRGGRGVPNDFL